MSDQPLARLIELHKRSDYEGYGFILNGIKGRIGHTISGVDVNGPAYIGGVRDNDIIIEVNGYNVTSEPHMEVVERIRIFSDHVRLLVVDPQTKLYFEQQYTIIDSYMREIQRIVCSTERPNMMKDSQSPDQISHTPYEVQPEEHFAVLHEVVEDISCTSELHKSMEEDSIPENDIKLGKVTILIPERAEEHSEVIDEIAENACYSPSFDSNRGEQSEIKKVGEIEEVVIAASINGNESVSSIRSDKQIGVGKSRDSISSLIVQKNDEAIVCQQDTLTFDSVLHEYSNTSNGTAHKIEGDRGFDEVDKHSQSGSLQASQDQMPKNCDVSIFFKSTFDSSSSGKRRKSHGSDDTNRSQVGGYKSHSDRVSNHEETSRAKGHTEHSVPMEPKRSSLKPRSKDTCEVVEEYPSSPVALPLHLAADLESCRRAIASRNRRSQISGRSYAQRRNDFQKL